MKKNPCKKKKLRINYFGKQEKPKCFLKYFRKKTKILKPFAPFYTIQNLKFSWSANHDGRHFFKPWPPNYFSAAKAQYIFI